MTSTIDIVMTLLFGGLVVIAVVPFFPFKWSLFALITLVHVRVGAVNQEPTIAVDLWNAARLIVLPTILLARTRFAALAWLRSNPGFILWMLFVSYAVVSILWSPFALSGWKQAGYFYSHTAMVAIFVYVCGGNKEATYRLLISSTIAALSLAVLQTAAFNSYSDRFTSFTNPQGFGLYLSLMLIMMLASTEGPFPRRRMVVAALVPVLVVAAYFNGSRTAAGSMVVSVALYSVFWSRFGRSPTRVGLALVGGACILLLLVSGVILSETVFPEFRRIVQSSRIFEASEILLGRNEFVDIGTFRFRADMNRLLAEQLSSKQRSELMFGSGTSSAGELIANKLIYYRGYDQVTVDANRTAHNEYLRAVYEWGIVGSLLFATFLCALSVGAIRLARRAGSLETKAVFLGVLSILGFMIVENVLASAGSPLGMGVGILLGSLISMQLTEGRSRGLPRPAELTSK